MRTGVRRPLDVENRRTVLRPHLVLRCDREDPLAQQEDVSVERRGRLRASTGAARVGRGPGPEVATARRALEEAARRTPAGARTPRREGQATTTPTLARLRRGRARPHRGRIILTAMSMRGKVIPFPRFPREPGGERGLVEGAPVRSGRGPGPQRPLRGEGIPTLLRSRLAHSVYPFSVGSQGRGGRARPGERGRAEPPPALPPPLGAAYLTAAINRLERPHRDASAAGSRVLPRSRGV